jgi:hypothetical protein
MSRQVWGANGGADWHPLAQTAGTTTAVNVRPMGSSIRSPSPKPVMTTLAATPHRVIGPAIPQDLAHRDRLPGTHMLASGDIDVA